MNGIKAAFAELGAPQSVSVDTWGVDYVLMNGDVSIYPCCAYRDNRTEKAISEVHRLVTQDRLYLLTGVSFSLSTRSISFTAILSADVWIKRQIF